MLDQKVIKTIENALANDKRVEIGIEYKDKINKTNPQIVIVEVSRKVNMMSAI